MPITSPHNDKLKTLRKLRQRRRDRERLGQFVAEGEDLLAAADAAGWTVVERFSVTGSGLPGTEVDPAALQSLTELASGTRTLAIYDERWQAVPLGPLCLYLHGVSDPGNVGTVLRSAEAFGACCVALGPGTRRSVRAEGRAGVAWARSSPCRSFAATSAALPGTTIALDADAALALFSSDSRLIRRWGRRQPAGRRRARGSSR